MKKILFIVLFGCFVLSVHAANKPEYAVYLIDTMLFKNANAVIRDYQCVFRVTAPGDATQKVKMVVTRLNQEAAYSSIFVNYDMYSKVKSLEASIYDKYGNLIRKIKKEEIQDFSAVSNGTMYADDRVKAIDFTYGTYPYTIEYEYEVSLKSIFLYPAWEVQDFLTSVESSSYLLILPLSISFKSKFYNLDVQPKTSLVEGFNLHRWEVKNVPAVKREKYVQDYTKLLATAYFVPSEFEVGGYKGSMLSWKEYGKFMYELNKDRDQLSPEMIKTVQSLIATATTEEEKIAALYQYMQKNMRYVSVQLGVGGWQTFDANYVEQNNYGDCKALSNFMKAMLKAAGIPSYMVLVYAGSGNIPFEAEEDFSFPRFNHVILHIPKMNYWLECTSQDDPPNYLGAFTADRNVLLITENGGMLTRTPKYDSQSNQQISRTEIIIEATGAAQVKSNIQCTSESQDSYRGYFFQYGKEALKKQFLEVSKLPIQELQHFEYVPDKSQPIGTLQYAAFVARYASKSGKRLFVPLNLVNGLNDVPPAVDNREQPIMIRQAYTEIDSIFITLPAGAKIESIGEGFSLETQYGSYKLEIQQIGDKVQCIRKLVIFSTKVPKEEYSAWRDFYQQVAKKDNSKMVILVSQA